MLMICWFFEVKTLTEMIKIQESLILAFEAYTQIRKSVV